MTDGHPAEWFVHDGERTHEEYSLGQSPKIAANAVELARSIGAYSARQRA